MSKKQPSIVDYIKNSGQSVRKIAKEIGIPEQRIYGWVNKNASPSYEDAQKVIAYLRIEEPKQIDLESKIHGMESLLLVLASEIAGMKAAASGEPIQSELRKIYKAAEGIS